MQYQQKITQITSSKRDNLKRCASAFCLMEALWLWIREEAGTFHEQEKHLQPLLNDVICSHDSLSEAIAARLARKLSRRDMPREEIEPLMLGVLRTHPQIIKSIAFDIWAIVDRDPACNSPLQAILFYKGFHAICTYRIGHALWNNNRHMMAFFFQNIGSEIFGVDIHPAAQIGCGIFLDHATSFVVGETAIIEDNVSILHEVTLGGTGKEEGDRHPIIRSGVLIGAGAKILGRVTIGECAKIGAGSVVLDDVPPHTTVAGVPAVIVGETTEPSPALDMCQRLKPE